MVISIPGKREHVAYSFQKAQHWAALLDKLLQIVSSYYT